jgi:hypothetical protein
MRILIIFPRQKLYFWSIACFISLVLDFISAGLSIVLLSQTVFEGRIPAVLVVFTAFVVLVVSGLTIFVFYKFSYSFLSLPVEVKSDSVLIKNTTSEKLHVTLQTAELGREYYVDARGRGSYIYRLQPLQNLKTENVEPGKTVFEKIDPEKASLEYEKSISFHEKINFLGIEVSAKNGKNLWVAFCQPYAAVFSSPRNQHTLILRPVFKRLKKIAKDLHKRQI